MNPRVILQPASELITIDECRAHLNIEPYETNEDGDSVHPDDDMIMLMQGAAREHCENFLGLTLAPRTYELALDSFPAGAITISAPLLEVQSITYQELDSDEQPVDVEADPSTYIVDPFGSRIVPVTTWPSVTAATNAVRIIYLSGTSESEPLPFAIRAAILLVLGHLYENREDTGDKALATIPLAAETLMRPLRVRLGMA